MVNQNLLNTLMNFKNQGKNPQAILQMLAQQNPQINILFNQMQQSGMSAQQFAKQMANQSGININEVMAFAKNLGF